MRLKKDLFHRSGHGTRSVLTLASVLTLGIALNAAAQHDHHQDAGSYKRGDDLGALSFPVSCDSEATAEFERGVALLHHMMYVESRSVFADLAKADPTCAMAHWGVAMTLFQPLWPTRPSPSDLEQGWVETQKAKTISPRSEREDAYIAAAEAFFSQPQSEDYWSRITRFEKGMESVFRAHPHDREAAALYALSLLSTAAQAREPMSQHAKAAKILLDIYDQEPTHPGAIHYTIHANDVEGRANESLDIVRSYDDIAPSVPHALHMPTHIFVRLGAWDDVILWNEKSAAAALDFPAGDKLSHHYPHALDYLIYAHLQRGDDAAAKEVLQRAESGENYQPTFISAFHLASMPARFAVERRRWEEAAKLPERTPSDLPWDASPWPEAITQFAKGLGAVRTGDLGAARAAVERLEALARVAEAAGEAYFTEQIEITSLAVSAWIAHGEGRSGEALRHMRSAAEREAATQKHPVTPGALQPAYELLGDLLLEMGRPADAYRAYESSLAAWPRRFHSQLGAARAAARAGDRPSAVKYYTEVLELVGDSGRRVEIEEAKGFLG